LTETQTYNRYQTTKFAHHSNAHKGSSNLDEASARPSPLVSVRRFPLHINDPQFAKVTPCTLTLLKPELKAPTAFQCLKLKYDEPLSNFAVNFNLRCYAKELTAAFRQVGRCRLSL
jgi:hypothetical protein